MTSVQPPPPHPGMSDMTQYTVALSPSARAMAYIPSLADLRGNNVLSLKNFTILQVFEGHCVPCGIEAKDLKKDDARKNVSTVGGDISSMRLSKLFMNGPLFIEHDMTTILLS